MADSFADSCLYVYVMVDDVMPHMPTAARNVDQPCDWLYATSTLGKTKRYCLDFQANTARLTNFDRDL